MLLVLHTGYGPIGLTTGLQLLQQTLWPQHLPVLSGDCCTAFCLCSLVDNYHNTHLPSAGPGCVVVVCRRRHSAPPPSSTIDTSFLFVAYDNT